MIFPLRRGVAFLTVPRVVRRIISFTMDTILALPGLHLTDRQVFLYMTQRTHHTQAAAAAIAGISGRDRPEPGETVQNPGGASG